MKYDHAVIHNGTLYPTGAEVPEEKQEKKEKPTENEAVKKNDRGTGKKS